MCLCVLKVEGNVNWSSTVVRHSSPGQTDTSLDRQVLTLDTTWLPDEQLRQLLWSADTTVGELTMNNYYFTRRGCIWFSMYPLRARHIKCLAVSSLHHIQVMLYYECKETLMKLLCLSNRLRMNQIVWCWFNTPLELYGVFNSHACILTTFMFYLFFICVPSTAQTLDCAEMHTLIIIRPLLFTLKRTGSNPNVMFESETWNYRDFRYSVYFRYSVFCIETEVSGLQHILIFDFT